MVENKVNGTRLYLPPVVSVIDDEATIRNLVKRNIRMLNYRTREYSSAFQFYKSLEEGTAGVPEAIITDFNMPGMNADTMITKIQESHPSFFKDVPIIGMTGDNSNIKLFNQVGVMDVLDKPFDSKELTDLLISLPTTLYFHS